MHEPRIGVAAGEGIVAGQHAVVVAGIGADVVFVKLAVEVHVELNAFGLVAAGKAVCIGDVALAGHQPLDRVHRAAVAAAVAAHIDDDVLDGGILLCALEAGENHAYGIVNLLTALIEFQRALAGAGVERLPALKVGHKAVKVDHRGVALLKVIIITVGGVAGSVADRRLRRLVFLGINKLLTVILIEQCSCRL